MNNFHPASAVHAAKKSFSPHHLGERSTELLRFCRSLAEWLHRDQIDTQGAPYYHHLSRVAELVAGDLDLACVAYLQDSIEDAVIGRYGLQLLQIPERIISLIEELSHRSGESYSAYIERVARNERATVLKLADLADNLDESRGPIPGTLADRYRKARAILLAAQWRHQDTSRSADIAPQSDDLPSEVR